jgi:hypothetical protein
MDLNPAAVHFDQSTHQIQPDSQSALRPIQRAINLRELIENLGEHFRGNADTIIPDLHDHIAAFLFDGRPDVPTLRCELGTVVNKVGEYLSQPSPIGIYIDRLGRYLVLQRRVNIHLATYSG